MEYSGEPINRQGKTRESLIEEEQEEMKREKQKNSNSVQYTEL